MALKLFIAVLFLVSNINIGFADVTVNENGKIKITIGTTAGCGDTVYFITNHLVPTYEQYKEFLEVEFVPWGRTRYENDVMVCQFLQNDCWANRVHRCALDQLAGNQDAQVHYMACEFSVRAAFLQGSYLCGQAVGLNLLELDYCVHTEQPRDRLNLAAEQAAEEPMSEINFVPSIHFNEVIDRPTHDQAFSRLSSVICFALAANPESGVTSCVIRNVEELITELKALS